MTLKNICSNIKQALKEKLIQYILMVCAINILAITLAIFHFADKITESHLKLAVDISTIIGYWATTIGVVIALIGLSNWRKEKLYDQKLTQFGELIDAAYTLKKSSQLIKGYLNICKSKINNPKHAYESLSYETQIMCNSKAQLMKLIATKIHIDRKIFNEQSTKLHSLFVQQQNLMYELLTTLELYYAGKTTINNVNAQQNITKINSWFGIVEKIHSRATIIERLSREKLEQEL